MTRHTLDVKSIDLSIRFQFGSKIFEQAEVNMAIRGETGEWIFHKVTHMQSVADVDSARALIELDEQIRVFLEKTFPTIKWHDPDAGLPGTEVKGKVVDLSGVARGGSRAKA